MSNLFEVYKSEDSELMVEVIKAGEGKLVSNDKSLKLFKENTVDAAVEKHVPVVENLEDGVYIKVGAVEHPMVQEHYIQWIEVITETKLYRKYLKPGDKPEAVFKIDEPIVSVREFCNLHGLWKK